MRPLNLVFQQPVWNTEEFADGAAGAFRRVGELQEAGDFEALRSLVAAGLLGELRDVAMAGRGTRTLLDVKPLGVFTTRMWPDENRHLSLWVTQVLRATEEYQLAGDVLHVERLHRWTFKRVLLSDTEEVVGDWQLTAMEKGRWVPPASPGRPPQSGAQGARRRCELPAQ